MGPVRWDQLVRMLAAKSDDAGSIHGLQIPAMHRHTESSISKKVIKFLKMRLGRWLNVLRALVPLS